MGIDEAGRGPVIGPLVIAGVSVNDDERKKLMAIGVRDSKQLSAIQREELFETIKSIGSHRILIVGPSEIDDAVNGKGGLNLNSLEAHKSADIINQLRPDAAVLDAPSTNTIAYRDLVKSLISNKKTPILAEHKADQNHPEVSAASILAKVTRDSEIDKIKKSIGIEFGSGYPSDPLTVSFLEQYYNKYPGIFRTSWASYKNVKNKTVQQTLAGFSDFVQKGFRKTDPMLLLEKSGYHYLPPTSEHEIARYKKNCTVVFYKKGTILVQGKDTEKKSVEALLGIN